MVALAAADTAADTAAAAADTTVAAAAEHPGVINLQALTSYGSPLPSLCR